MFQQQSECYYYQGFNDVATVIRTVLPRREAVQFAARVAAGFCY